MATEIEHKYILDGGDGWRRLITKPPLFIRQAYLQSDKTKTVRIRLQDETGWLVIKGAKVNASCPEFDYQIPFQDAQEIYDLTVKNSPDNFPVIKLRWEIQCGKDIWEVDEFLGVNYGLIVAEVELHSEDEEYSFPAEFNQCIGANVTFDSKYSNAALWQNPYSQWSRIRS